MITAPLFKSPGVQPPQPVDIVVIQPPGYPHSAAFNELAETVVYGFLTLGYDAKLIRNEFRLGVPTIVFGAHLLSESDIYVLPTGAVIYNLEQFDYRAWGMTPRYLELLARHHVWDFSVTNAAAVRQFTGNSCVRHVPIGYVPEMTRIAAASPQDIDVLFYGSITPRRKAIIDAISATGLKVMALFNVYGQERDNMIGRSKVVLNLHQFQAWRFEAVRVSYLLSNRKAIVCECDRPQDIEPDLQSAVVAAVYDDLVEACVRLVHSPVERERLEETGFTAFCRRNEVQIIQSALTAVTPKPPFRSNNTVRHSYLTLLAKSLTNSIYGDPSTDFWSDGKYDPRRRALGRDWPALAMTMIGEARLANLRYVVEIILAEGIVGDLIETGVWRGGACIFMRGLLEAYGVFNRRVWVADSFEGLPPPDPQYPADNCDRHHQYRQLSISLEEVKENFAKFGLLDDQVVFLKGWFSDTLQKAPIEQLALLRLDGDMYGSTMDSLNALYHKVSPGGFVVVDDYGAVAGCRQAITDFRSAREIDAPIIDIDGFGVYWRIPAPAASTE